MKKKAHVLAVVKTEKTGTQILKVKLDTIATKAQCTVREGEAYTSCAGCAGCSHGTQTGLFAVSGDEVLALNETPRKAKAGDTLLLSVSEAVQKRELLFAVFLPLILALIGFAGAFSIFKTELSGIIGVFIGIMLGVLISTVAGKRSGTAKLPRVEKIL